jgi:hypothetical protein
MQKPLIALAVVLALLTFSTLVRLEAAPPQSVGIAQNEQPPAHDGWGRTITAPVKNQTSAPAPRHDISGTWEPANGFLDGLGMLGAKAMPEDGKPEHELPTLLWAWKR